jgi:hypothetical protein
MNEKPAAVIAFPNKPEDRLRVALRELETALADQSMAFQEFRMNMALLGSSVGGLERSLESYRGTLDAVATDVATANHTAREVEARTDQLLR